MISNYRKYGINLIDFNKWFVQMKDTSSSKLFPQQGIHWSYYGAYLAADSIIKYIEDKRKCDLPDYVTSFETNQKANYGDEDLEHILNLIYKLPEYKMSYPKISFAKDSTKIKC
ncbi:MAG: hypothetical protein IPP29_04270 [Bacteroidetes bacterium]|nr:hypothetical protein [Bacteroidota bacterium]